MAGSVARISIAPVKSLGLVHPECVDLQVGGVRGDRRFWLVDGDGRLFNNKRSGPLRAIRPEWDETTHELTLAFPDGASVGGTVALGRPFTAVLYGRPHVSRSVVGPWQAAISAYAGEPLTLLWSESHATDRGAVGGDVSLVSQASLRRLGDEAAATEPVDGRRFRMMLEVAGVDAHEEDTWIGARIRVGGAEVLVNGDIGRCVVTSQHPDTGIVDLDTLGTLARYRREGRVEPLPFGIYGTVASPGPVAIGDEVRLLD
jgi:MOSC domain-containing protein